MSIRKRGRTYQVRVAGFPARTAPTREAAETIELDLKRRRSLGNLFEEPSTSLGNAIDGLLARVEATRSPSPKTREFNRRCAKFWAVCEDVPVARLRRAKVEDLIYARDEASEVREERA